MGVSFGGHSHSQNNPILSLEELTPTTIYPNLVLHNPQRRWVLRNNEAGQFEVYDQNLSATRLSIDAEGKLDVNSLKISGSEVLTPQRVLQNITNTATGFKVGPETAGLQLIINDIPGARWALASGGYDLTFKKHKSDTDTWENAFILHGDDATLLPQLAEFLVPIKTSGYGDLASLRIGGVEVIESSRMFKNIDRIRQPGLLFEYPYAGVWYPRFDIANAHRMWRVLVSADPGDYYLIDATSEVTRMIVHYNTSSDSTQFTWRNSTGTEIMRIDYEGDLTITGKLTQSGCPEFSKMTLDEIKHFIMQCKEKEYHKTQEEVMALMHLVLNLIERVEKLEAKLEAG
jgi:hypothetical protein